MHNFTRTQRLKSRLRDALQRVPRGALRADEMQPLRDGPGLVGAAGSLGGLLPPVAQGLGQDLVGSYVVGFLILAALALIGLAGYVRHDRRAAC